MRLVYQTAHRVIVWLGASSDEINWLFEWMNILDQNVLTIAHPHTLSTWKNEWLRLVSCIHGRPPPIHIGQALLILLRREWFYRVWVIQEAAHAKSAIITCGYNEVNSRAFIVMPSLLDIVCVKNAQARLEILPGVLRETSLSLGESSQQLLTLLQRFGRSESSDPRDIIYALVGLSENTSSELLQPDYQLRVGEVIQRAVAFFMIQKHDLSMDTPLHSLPTWGIDDLLDSLHDLTLSVFQWATEHARDVLLYDLIIIQSRNNGSDAQGIQRYTSCTGTYGPPIMVAIKKGNFALFELLLTISEINFELRDSTGKTALSLAVEQGNLKIVSLILQKKADINSRDSDDRAATPLWNAAACGNLEMARLLIERGADTKLVANDTGSEATLLWVAASRGHTKLVMYLLEVGVEVEIAAGATTELLKDSVGTKILLWAATCGGHTEAVRALAILGTDLDSLSSSFWVPPIWVAASLGYADIVDLLAKHGANIEARDGYYGMTPYLRAAEQKMPEVMKVLIKYGANTSAKAFHCGKSALIKSLSQERRVMELVSQWPPSQTSFTFEHYFQSGETSMQWPFRGTLQKLLCETVGSCSSGFKAAMSTGASIAPTVASGTTARTSIPLPFVDCQVVKEKLLKYVNGYHQLTKDVHITVESSSSTLQPQKKPLLSEQMPWEFYLLRLHLNDEPGTLWNSSLCAIFHECLITSPGVGRITASEYAARIDDVFWKYYRPFDPLLQFREDRVTSGYLLHVWSIFIELGKRVPHDNPAQEKLVELLKELILLPPFEAWTWEVCLTIYFLIHPKHYLAMV